jgi:hypothetical protein
VLGARPDLSPMATRPPATWRSSCACARRTPPTPRELGLRPFGIPHAVTRPRSHRSRFRPAGPACSTPPGPARQRACRRESVREAECQLPTHNFLRLARRSTDGQAILDGLPAAREPGSDLRFCGAPLRNRTVDLLLTMSSGRARPSEVTALISENVSPGERSQAPIRLSRARFCHSICHSL